MTAPANSPGWLADRTGWARWLPELRKKRVHGMAIVPMLTGAGLFLLLVLVATGCLLAMHYQPHPEHAEASVQALSDGVPFGALVRGVHQWASDLLVVVAAAWLLSLIVSKLYLRPRELIWVGAVATALLVVQLAFTGSVLPYAAQSLEHARVVAGMARHVPVVGDWLARFVLGGEHVTAATLTRAHGLHTAVLPLTLGALLSAQLFMLRRTRDDDAHDAKPSIPLYPDMFVRVGALCSALLLALVSLAIFVPRLAPAAVAAEARPPWYLASIHQLLLAAPDEALGQPGASLVLGGVTIVVAALFALPFYDPRGSFATRYAAIAGVALGIALTVHGAL